MTKAEALRAAARNIGGGERYSWSLCGECNCGHLAQVVTGWMPNRISRMCSDDIIAADNADVQISSYSTMATVICATTGQPYSRVVIALMDAGFTGREIADLEYLDNADVRRAAGLSPCDPGHAGDKAYPAAVIAYLNAWADLIDAQQPPAPLIELKPDARAALDRFATSDVNDRWMANGLDRLTEALAD